jgi:hypothetical protein
MQHIGKWISRHRGKLRAAASHIGRFTGLFARSGRGLRHMNAKERIFFFEKKKQKTFAHLPGGQ